MKALLISPPMFTIIQAETPTYVTTDRGYNPPLGIISIATCINKRPGLSAEVLDTQAEEMNFDQIKDAIKKSNPAIIGMAANTFTFIDCLKLANEIKVLDSNIKIVLGGPHANLFPNETIAHAPIDFLITGEGERAFPDLMEKLEKGIEEIKKVPGLLFKHDGNVINTGPAMAIDPLDELPIVDRTLTDYKKYSSIISKRNPITTAVTSRGCPFKCTFCDRPQMGGKSFRMNSAKRIVDEMEECLKLGIHEIMYYDDTFTLNRKRIVDMCKMIEERGIDMHWDMRTRVDTVDPELLKMMRKAGLQRINLGVESGTEKGLATIKKGTNLVKVKAAFDNAKKAGLRTLAYVMVGLPGETKEEMMETIKFSKDINPDFVHFTVFTPYPKTEIWRNLIAKGDMSCVNSWTEYAKNPTTAFDPPTCNEFLSKEELFKVCDHAYKSFYFRPKYMLKELAQVRSFGELKKKAKAGLKVLMA
jgi:anaerobic magnesium-protoporphyrin IX monomethyl ester cyclase